MSEVAHRPGPLKQRNKSHKSGRHRTKRELNKNYKEGKVKQFCGPKKHEARRTVRRNIAKQKRKSKWESIVADRRFLTLSGLPLVVSVTMLSNNVNKDSFLKLLYPCVKATVTETHCGTIKIKLQNIKTNFLLIFPDPNSVTSTLDAAKVADVVLFLFSSDCSVNELNETLLDAVVMHFLPSSLFCVQGLKSLSITKKSQKQAEFQKFIGSKITDSKLQSLDNESDLLNTFRKLAERKLKICTFRDLRSFIISDKIEHILDDSTDKGELQISGYVRGYSLAPERLLYLPGIGTHQIAKIVVRNFNDMTVQQELYPDIEQQEKLDSVTVPDLCMADVEDENENIQDMSVQTRKIIVPEGTSEYQAAWYDNDAFCEEEEVEDTDMDEEDSENHKLSDNEMTNISDDDDNGIEDRPSRAVTFADEIDCKEYDNEVDHDEEMQEYERLKAAKENEMFPDEIDTPTDVPARIRFRKYRGLASFRTSPWSFTDDLPPEYSTIFEFENYSHAVKTIKSMERARIGGVEPGLYVTVHVKDVPKFSLDLGPVYAFSLFPHEQKMSVCHFLLNRTIKSTMILQSKERLIFYAGFRRFSACPIYSESARATKFKREKFFNPNSTLIASVYAPITIHPCPVLAFKEDSRGSLHLVASGSLYSVNPRRIILKRVILSGHPHKINGRTAIIKYMFFNPDDVRYFSKIQLNSKYGRSGHILEPVGTHGHMRCDFNNSLKSQDAVTMCLYKRVYPKWSYTEILDKL